YQDVPRFVDEQMQKKGAERLMIRGEGDASGDFELNVESWRSKLWADMMGALGLQLSKQSEAVRSTLTVEFVKDYAGSRLANSYEAVHAEVVSNRELQKAGSGRSTRHIEIALPDGVTYE
ncbi:hypothetical protein KW823_26615, partial [Enterobacter quasiroggenkampii]|nr:hypothetical protein [Enterobacter quasiroggenkampii]